MGVSYEDILELVCGQVLVANQAIVATMSMSIEGTIAGLLLLLLLLLFLLLGGIQRANNRGNWCHTLVGDGGSSSQSIVLRLDLALSVECLLGCAILDEEHLGLVHVLWRLGDGILQVGGRRLLGQHIDHSLLLLQRLGQVEGSSAVRLGGCLHEEHVVVVAWLLRQLGELLLDFILRLLRCRVYEEVLGHDGFLGDANAWTCTTLLLHWSRLEVARETGGHGEGGGWQAWLLLGWSMQLWLVLANWGQIGQWHVQWRQHRMRRVLLRLLLLLLQLLVEQMRHHSRRLWQMWKRLLLLLLDAVVVSLLGQTDVGTSQRQCAHD